MDHMHGKVGAFPLRQNADETAGIEVFADEPVGKHRDAEPGARGFANEASLPAGSKIESPTG